MAELTVDPLVHALNPATIDEDQRRYLSLLDDEAPEEAIQQFLAEHTYFFNGILRLFSPAVVYSRVKLGADFEVDFALPDPSSFGIEWCLLEIEAPNKRMFTKAGDPTAHLTHAIQQIRDWQAWLHENLDYARKLMRNIELELTRCRGHFTLWGRRSPDAERFPQEATGVPAGVSPAAD